MSLWQDLKDSWNRPLETANTDDFNKMSVAWNIVKEDITLGELTDRRKRFHKWFKFKFFIPVLLIGEKILGKYLMTPDKLDKGPHNKIIVGFNDTFIQTLHEWHVTYRKEPIRADKTYTHVHSDRLLRTMLATLNTGYTHDSAYRIFFDMFAINWAIKVGELYPGKITHLLYNVKTLNDLDFRSIIAKSSDHLFFTLEDGTLVAVKRGDAIMIGNTSKEIADKKLKE